MDEAFWMVWNPNGYTPRIRHESFDRARNEARRLAKDRPGEQFIVLQAVGFAAIHDPVEWVDLPAIPF